MAKQFFAAAFSAVTFLLLPPADLSRAEAWIVVMWLYVLGIILACTAEEMLEKVKKHRG